MTTFGQGKLLQSFTIRYLIVDENTYFALIGRKTLNELEVIVSTLHLKMKFATLMGEIVTVNVDQKQAQQCYGESLKMTPYPTIRESGKPYSSSSGSNNQVMSIVGEFPLRTLTIYKITKGNLRDTFNIDP